MSLNLPPEIWEIVQEAGRENVFWWSNRWRQGRKPPVGNASPEMTNTVPGGVITATQDVASAMPISHNRGYSLEGDDRLVGNGAVPTSFNHYTIGIVARNRNDTLSGNGYAVSQRDTTSGDISQIYLSFRDTDRVQVTVGDDAGNNDNHNISIGDNTTLFAAVATVDLANGRSYLTSENGATTASGASTYSLGSITGANELSIGALAGGSGFIDGLIREALIVPTHLISDDGADNLRDRMWWRHQ